MSPYNSSSSHFLIFEAVLCSSPRLSILELASWPYRVGPGLVSANMAYGESSPPFQNTKEWLSVSTLLHMERG